MPYFKLACKLSYLVAYSIATYFIFNLVAGKFSLIAALLVAVLFVCILIAVSYYNETTANQKLLKNRKSMLFLFFGLCLLIFFWYLVGAGFVAAYDWFK